MKRNRSGISLIVLVITVIVMIILAGSVIISLSNSGIIGKANEAVDANNLKQVEQLAALAWSEAYIDKLSDSTVDLKSRVEEALEKNKVDQNKYVIKVTDSGVSVKAKTTLGALVKSADDYGKTVDYTVTVDIEDKVWNDVISEYETVITKEDVTISDWKVLYEDEINGYIYIISSSWAEESKSLTGGNVNDLTVEDKALYEKFRVGNGQKYALKYEDNSNGVAYLIKYYGKYANKALYGSENVIGAIGGPTIELLATSWNAKGYTPAITMGVGDRGYTINGGGNINVANDELYVPSGYKYLLASPLISGDIEGYIIDAGQASISGELAAVSRNIRPVVCLSSNTPAVVGDDVDFSLIKSAE